MLLYKNEEFTFDVKTRTGFSFNFSNQDSGMPALKMKKMMKNRKTPNRKKNSQEDELGTAQPQLVYLFNTPPPPSCSE